MAQETAVDWLDNELWKLRLKARGQEISIDIYFEEEAKLIKHAKEMEKEQIQDAFMEGDSFEGRAFSKDFENYYNETYNTPQP